MENQGPRKATDVLLDLESKLDSALSIIKSQDLNIKLLSNKLNLLIEKMDKQTVAASFVTKPQFTVEAVQNVLPPQFMQPAQDEETNVPIFSEHKLAVDAAPIGFRRTSRPETYAGDNAYLQKPPQEPVKMPVQTLKPPPGRNENSNVTVPQQAMNQGIVPNNPITKPTAENKLPQEQLNQGAIPVEQRVVDKNSKSVFLADVEIVDLKTGNQIFKTRTSGAGKWAAPLSIGNYRVTISKRESVTKQKVEVVQDISVDGSHSPLILQMIIIK